MASAQLAAVPMRYPWTQSIRHDPAPFDTNPIVPQRILEASTPLPGS